MSIVSRSAVLFALLVALFVPASASAGVHFYYLDPRQIDLTALLPPPPDPVSAQERSDEERVAAAVMARTPTELFEAEEDSMRIVFFFSKSIGPGFESAKLPLTTPGLSGSGFSLRCSSAVPVMGTNNVGRKASETSLPSCLRNKYSVCW